MSISEKILTPIGRLVQGSLYEAQTTDPEGRPLVYKSGPDAGKPYSKWFFVLAIPKGNEKHWAETEWGKKIWHVGHSSFPKGQANSPTFAWKLKDGDSQIPNKKGNKPCDQEGFAGHWCLHFSSTFSPTIVNSDGSEVLLQKDFINLGDYIQVFGNVSGNDSEQQPGVHLNHSHIAFQAYGTRIIRGVDPKSLGFGNCPLPAGAFLVPKDTGFNPENTRSVPSPMQTQSLDTPSLPTPAPYREILNPPTAPLPKKMTAKAQGIPYEDYIKNGWTEALLIQHGYMEI